MKNILMLVLSLCMWSVLPAQNTTLPVDSAALSLTQACGCGQEGPVWLAWIIIVIIAGLFVYLALKTKLLRDDVDPSALLAYAKTTVKYKDATDADKIPRPYSLSRVQMGIWTVIISCCCIYMVLKCCGVCIDFTASVLSLMGISAGTAAAGNVIDSSATGDKHQNQPSDGFFPDILSDKNGISIHRFQNVVFLFITAIIFIYKIPAAQCHHLPELDSTLIALNGISTVTYLGLKINENK